MNEAVDLLLLISYAALCFGAIFLIVCATFIIGSAIIDFLIFIKEKIEDYIIYYLRGKR